MKPDKPPLTRVKYWLMSHLPGKRGLRYLRKYSRSMPTSVQAEFDAALEAARGRICIDLGANMGLATLQMAPVASHVYAFEPDPWTAQELRKAVGPLDNVTVIEAAAGTKEGTFPVYRSAKFGDDPRKGSLSTTLVADKINVDTTQPIDVKVLDFRAFLTELDADIALIKIDIEGAEVALLEALFEDPVCARIDHIFVETHETRVPALAQRSIALRRRARNMRRPRVNMDWM